MHSFNYLLTAIELSLGGSRPYTSTDRINKNKYELTEQYKDTVQRIQNTENKITDITKTPTHTHNLTLQTPHITKTTHTHTHTHTHYKTHTYTHTHTHTPTHYKTHTYTHTHITKPTHTHTHTVHPSQSVQLHPTWHILL
jgi:hypothetical protein